MPEQLLKQIGLAFHNYHDAFKVLPPGYTATGAWVDGTTDTTPGWAWGAYILPFIDQAGLYATYTQGSSFSQTTTYDVATYFSTNAPTVLYTFVCPDDILPPAPGSFGATGADMTAVICNLPPSSYAAVCGGGIVTNGTVTGTVSTTAATGNGPFYRNSAVTLGNIIDGTSNTVFVEERVFASA